MQTTVDTLRLAWQMRRAWWFTATARTKARFARTFLGSVWLGLSNVLSVGVLTFVYGAVFKVANFKEYAVYLGLGLVVWNLIASSVGSAASLFETNSRNLLNNNIHPIFYTLEEWVFQIQTFAQSFGIVVLLLAFLQPTLLSHLLLYSWLPILNLVIFVYWVPLIICLLGARLRDMYQLVPIVMQLIFLMSPILYQKNSLGSLAWIARLNPFFRVLESFRDALIHGEISIFFQLAMLIANLLGAYISVLLLDRERRQLPFLF